MSSKKGYWDIVPDAVNPWQVWSGTGTANAPTGLGYNTVGFDSDGASTGTVYTYSKEDDTWRTTTQTVAGFFGV